MRTLILVSLALAVIVGCGKQARLAEGDGHAITADEYPDRSVGVGLIFEDDTPEGRLRAADAGIVDGRFPEAIAVYRQLAHDATSPATVREDALFQLGAAHAHVLNPAKDLDAALAAFSWFVAAYPESRHRGTADAHIARLREVVDQP